jgi:hypothetical protein
MTIDSTKALSTRCGQFQKVLARRRRSRPASAPTRWHYLYDDGTMEHGYRFIWTSREGRLQPASAVEFTAGNEPPWVASMVGSRKASESFAECVINLGGVPWWSQP